VLSLIISEWSILSIDNINMWRKSTASSPIIYFFENNKGRLSAQENN